MHHRLVYAALRNGHRQAAPLPSRLALISTRKIPDVLGDDSAGAGALTGFISIPAALGAEDCLPASHLIERGGRSRLLSWRPADIQERDWGALHLQGSGAQRRCVGVWQTVPDRQPMNAEPRCTYQGPALGNSSLL